MKYYSKHAILSEQNFYKETETDDSPEVFKSKFEGKSTYALNARNRFSIILRLFKSLSREIKKVLRNGIVTRQCD